MKLSRRRKVLYVLIAGILSIGLSLSVGEAVFRILEREENSRNRYEGEGGIWVPDERWGWKPSIGAFRSVTSEFDVTGSINSLYMNDDAIDTRADESRTRVLVVGDSHTYAIGVSTKQAWPQVLEGRLNALHAPNQFSVYNGGNIGFNMHQYFLRLKDQGPTIRPHYVVVGLSYATDLYDLLPPDRGGWIYGGDRARDYFDFGPEGRLVERHWDAKSSEGTSTQQTTAAFTVREVLGNFATFRYLRRSKLALFIGSHARINGQSLWPNMDIVLEKKVSERHEYQWRLFEALLSAMKAEADRLGAELIVVGIPYLPQVYDDLWQSTYGRDDRYSRTASIERVASYCKKLGIPYIDTLNALQIKNKELGRWLHYPKDAHPTVEGHLVITDEVVKTRVIRPQTATTH